MSEHCSVVLPRSRDQTRVTRGSGSRELYITGGRGRGDRVLKLSLDTGKEYCIFLSLYIFRSLFVLSKLFKAVGIH